MSRLALAGKDDYPDAAGKHLDDAIKLADAGRFDGAAYLAGYVVECALKSLIVLASGAQQWGKKRHDLNALSAKALRLAALPHSRTAKYDPALNRAHSLYHSSSGWSPSIRYRPPGVVAEHTAWEWLDEARDVYQRTIAQMRLDGVV